jgi:predicted ATP-grasp superfamily ATP-dependent carboligase
VGTRQRSPSATPPVGAVVLGGDYQGLGIVRSLGRRGIPVWVVDDEPSVARFSRYTTRSLRVPDLRHEGSIVETVLETGARHGLEGWLLYATRDEIVAALSRARTRLRELFRVWTPPWETVQYADDKRLTYQLAARLGVPTPRTWYPANGAELDEIDADGSAFVVKPAIKENFIYATRVKGWFAPDRRHLRERFTQAAAILPEREVLVQEFIPGDGAQQFAFCAFFKNGRSIGRMTVCRRRQRPPDLGRSSTFVETVDVPTIVDYSEQFLRQIDYYGLVELEYKLDGRDGQYKLLDVNARTWGYHSIGPPAGVDFPFLLFADQLGEEVDSAVARAGISWVRLTTDASAAVLELRRGRLRVRDYIRSLRKAAVEAVFAQDDPIPGLAELALIPYLVRTRNPQGGKR